jgi:uncharacterized membrane protein
MKNKNSVTIIRVVVMLLLVLVVIPLLPILISGRWNWWEAWVMLAVFVLSFILSRALAVRKSPISLRSAPITTSMKIPSHGINGSRHW